MFPTSGRGAREGKQIRPWAKGGMPEALYYPSQMDLQYALHEWLSQFGTC